MTLSTGIITTIAGTGATTYTGDGGPATSASIYNTRDVTLDLSGILSYLFPIMLLIALLPVRQRVHH